MVRTTKSTTSSLRCQWSMNFLASCSSPGWRASVRSVHVMYHLHIPAAYLFSPYVPVVRVCACLSSSFHDLASLDLTWAHIIVQINYSLNQLVSNFIYCVMHIEVSSPHFTSLIYGFLCKISQLKSLKMLYWAAVQEYAQVCSKVITMDGQNWTSKWNESETGHGSSKKTN